MRQRFLVCALLFLGLFWGGCFNRHYIKGPGDINWGLRVSWYGHSCFGFEDSTGRFFLIDPFDETIGYDLAWVTPDAVLVTHSHFDHDYLRRAVNYELMDSTGVHTLSGIEVTGLLGYHDNEQGQRHGITRFYVWEMGGIRLAHLGDVGQSAFTAEQKEELKNIDVLFVPVGGKTTVDAAGALSLVKEINPRVVVPMHYGNPRVRFFEFDPVDNFTKLFDRSVALPEAEFQLRRADLPAETTLFVPALPAQK